MSSCIHRDLVDRGRYLFAISAGLMAITGRMFQLSSSSRCLVFLLMRRISIVYLLNKSQRACIQHMLSENMSCEALSLHKLTRNPLIGCLAASGVADGYTTTACFLIFEGACGLNLSICCVVVLCLPFGKCNVSLQE